ncbi:hypothetical protein NDU88_003144 [Pleurodeles waltl]|uniref:Uncharacterized protein n=1 Tax=Pleurodeles waltl TaxID=8319 RepID=A0AAV7L112_PLEWA|nr:hypothetical protein NDU88_003144 [Pleurodeles waltl]
MEQISSRARSLGPKPAAPRLTSKTVAMGSRGHTPARPPHQATLCAAVFLQCKSTTGRLSRYPPDARPFKCQQAASGLSCRVVSLSPQCTFLATSGTPGLSSAQAPLRRNFLTVRPDAVPQGMQQTGCAGRLHPLASSSSRASGPRRSLPCSTDSKLPGVNPPAPGCCRLQQLCLPSSENARQQRIMFGLLGGWRSSATVWPSCDRASSAPQKYYTNIIKSIWTSLP